jgi:HSP20 family protein
MSVTRYNPFADVEDFPAGLRLFQDTVNRLLSEPSSARPWAPAVDILETENELVLKADVPEVELKDIDIQIENNSLTLRGERKFEANGDGGYHRIERGYGSFVRAFTVPNTVDTEKVRADYKDGVLTVMLPKKEMAKPRQVRIEARQ